MKKPGSFLSACLLAAVCASFVQADGKARAAAEVQAEFTMPIYRNPSQAELTVVVPKAMADVRAASVSVATSEGKEVWNGSFRLSAGRNACVLKNIGSLAPGRYLATVTAGETSMKRMLRIERIPAMPRPDGPIHLRKIFFTPDDWLFESFRDLEIRYSRPEFTEAYHSSRPDVVNLYGSSFHRAVDGLRDPGTRTPVPPRLSLFQRPPPLHDTEFLPRGPLYACRLSAQDRTPQRRLQEF
jgi:hypothetical protein